MQLTNIPLTVHVYQSALKRIEWGMNLLYGKMSPQLEMELEWQRQETLKLLLAAQLETFNKG